MTIRILPLAGVVLTACALTSPLSAQSKPYEKVMLEASLALVSAASDRNLNDIRFGCVAGTTPVFMERQKAAGNAYAPADIVCLATLKEATKRGTISDLYSNMQPGNAVDELKRVIRAAAGDQPNYINVEGITKKLGCELALDAGYVFGSKTSKPFAAERSDDALRTVASRCFNSYDKPSPAEAFAAGVRIAQIDARK